MPEHDHAHDAEHDAGQDVAREREVRRDLTSPRTVAVAPFRNLGSAEYAHLGKALESMLIDNLSLLPGVRVLDREHVMALIERARRAGPELPGEDAAIRAGRLLTAGSLSDWTASPTHLRLEALLVDVDAGTAIASASAETLAVEFYTLVPGVAKQFVSSLGHPLDALPPDVRQKIEQPHTKSLKAALLFGEALDALDRKDVDAAHKACEALDNEDADFPLAKRKCGYIELEWLALATVVSAVEPMALAMAAAGEAGAGAAGGAASAPSEALKEQATEPSSYQKYAPLALLALLLIGGGAGGYALSQGGGSGGAPNPVSPPPVVNNPPRLQGIGDLSVHAGDSAAIDMQCVDPDATSTSIQNTSTGPGSSFDQTSGNPATGRYLQPTTADQAGQVFNVAFVCTDSGNPPATDTKTARISVLAPVIGPTPTPAPAPTPTRTLAASPVPQASSPPSTPTPRPAPSPSPTRTPIPTASPSPRPTGRV